MIKNVFRIYSLYVVQFRKIMRNYIWYTYNMSVSPFNKAKILSELWMNHREEEAFEEFVDYNDIGLPLAHVIYTGIVLPTPTADQYIEETFDMLLVTLGFVDENGDTINEEEWEDLEEMLSNSQTYFPEA